jgi:hypothetical protein
MWARLKIARDGQMSPLERAAVLGVVIACIVVLALIFDDDKGPERPRIWELPLEIGAMVALGLLSALSLLPRAAINAALGTAVFIATGILAARPHTLDAGVVVGSLLSTALQGASIGAVDLPQFWRRWASALKSRAPCLLKWSAYYAVTAVVWVCLLVSFDALCNALVSTVLPSPKLLRSVAIAPVGIGMFLIAAIMLLVGRGTLRWSWSRRIARPTIVGMLFVVYVSVLIEAIGLVLGSMNVKIFTPWDLSEVVDGAARWSKDPMAALGEQLAVAAALSMVVVPLTIGLYAWWDRARAQGRRSRFITGLVPLLIVILSVTTCGGMGLYIGNALGGLNTISVFNRAGAALGLIVGGGLSWWWLRWSAKLAAFDVRTYSNYVSGGTTVPEHIAKAVKASREAIDKAQLGETK